MARAENLETMSSYFVEVRQKKLWPLISGHGVHSVIILYDMMQYISFANEKYFEGILQTTSRINKTLVVYYRPTEALTAHSVCLAIALNVRIRSFLNHSCMPQVDR